MKKIIFIFVSLLFLFPVSCYANPIDLANESKSAIMLEASTGKIIFEKNSNERLAPASMTKMMSMLLFIEAIESKVISFEDKVTVSEYAAGMGGSQIFLETGEVMSVLDLFKGIAIGSANDATVALAETIAGNIETFVSMMNEKAKVLNLKNTNFVNATGLDVENHYSSAFDMSLIAKELVKHEKVLEFTSIYEDYLRVDTNEKFWLVNTNKLVRFYDKVDGLKTGFTTNAGYCLTATAKKNNMRLIAVVMGESTSKIRNKEVSEMLDYGFSWYKTTSIFTKGNKLKMIKIDKGKVKTANICLTEDIILLNKKNDKKNNIEYKIEITNNSAPILKGDKVGYIHIYNNDKKILKKTLTIDKSIKKANFFDFYIRSLGDLITGDINF